MLQVNFKHMQKNSIIIHCPAEVISNIKLFLISYNLKTIIIKSFLIPNYMFFESLAGN